MWTKENRGRYDRSQQRYPSDLTAEEWRLVELLIPPAKRGGGKRRVDMREVVNGIMYIPSTGCQWRYLPKDLPSKSTVFRYFDLWNYDGTLLRLHHELYVLCREQAGRAASPTVAIIDCQSVKSGAISHTRARPFAWARTATISVTFSSRSFNEKPVRSSASCEVSTLERSRMSSMRCSRLPLAQRKICTYLLCCWERGVFASRSAMPMIAFIGGRTPGKGRDIHDKLLIAGAVEVRQRKPGTKRDKRKGGRYAGRVRLAVAPDRNAESLCGFIEGAVAVGVPIITDDWSGYASLANATQGCRDRRAHHQRGNCRRAGAKNRQCRLRILGRCTQCGYGGALAGTRVLYRSHCPQ